MELCWLRTQASKWTNHYLRPHNPTFNLTQQPHLYSVSIIPPHTFKQSPQIHCHPVPTTPQSPSPLNNNFTQSHNFTFTQSQQLRLHPLPQPRHNPVLKIHLYPVPTTSPSLSLHITFIHSSQHHIHSLPLPHLHPLPQPRFRHVVII